MSTGSTQRPGPPGAPPEGWEPLLRLARLAAWPLERFLRIEAASGIVLLVSTAAALALANSRWAVAYAGLWSVPLGVRIGGFAFERTLAWFVDDALMVIFFFVVGLEIRRELHHGELSEWRRAAIPAAAALGGMLAPAGIYLLFAGAPETRAGWGVPMATDIAFAVGILTLLGKRVPAALRVLLLALAVIDDLGAIVVIALFYSSGVALAGLLVAAGGVAGILAMQRLGVRSRAAYVVPGAITWAGIYAAGVHPTIAGVIVGFTTPVSPRAPEPWLPYADGTRREAPSPAESLIGDLHPWVAFGVMPAFALANAGVSLGGLALDARGLGVAAGVAVGLVVGKPLGVLLAIWLTLRLRIGTLPTGLNRSHLLVLGVVAGVGFTMSLFIAQLAFHGGGALLVAAKLGVLVASAAAAVLALILGRVLLPAAGAAGAARSADEAEVATDA